MPSESSAAYAGRDHVAARAITTTQLLGQVLFLVGIFLGRDLAPGTARICSFVGFGMLMASSFGGERFRVGPFAMGWLFATATAIGLGLGPVISYFATVQTDTLTQAAVGTAATVVATGIFVSIVNIFVSLLNIFQR